MVVLDQFYQIVEKNTKKVPLFWKVSHVLVFIGAGICGFITSFAFGQMLDDFNYFCVLDANVVFSNTTNLTANLHNHPDTFTVQAIDVTRTIWGATSKCQFCQFTPLFTMISAIIWGAFFVIITRGGGGYASDLLSRPWAIVYPCIFFTVVTFIIYTVSMLKLRGGLNAFCKQFISQFGTETCVPEINIYAKQFHDDAELRSFSDFFLNRKLAVTSSEIGIWMWVIQLCLLVARIVHVVDFDLHLVTIFSKEEEVVERITDPDMDEYEDDEETSPV